MGLFSLILLCVVLFCFFKKSLKKKEKPSSFTLFSVRIFPETEEELKRLGKKEKDWIGLMEDFYRDLISPDFFGDLPRVAFEVARVKGEIGFYVSVPKGFEDSIKRKVSKFFPEARMEKIDKYNIFSEKEEITCGWIKIKNSHFLPFPNDSFSVFADALANLKKGEEAVIQVILRKKHLLEENIRIVVSVKGKKRSKEVFLSLANCFKNFLSKFSIKEAKNSKEFIFLYNFRLFDSKQAVFLKPEELAGIFQFPAFCLKDWGILRTREAIMPASFFQKGILLGYNQYHKEKKEVRMSKEERAGVFSVVGKWRTGKSSFLLNLIEQDVLNGEGVGVLDSQGDLFENVLGVIPEKRAGKVIIFDPLSSKRIVGFNPLEKSSFKQNKEKLIEVFSQYWKEDKNDIRNALLLLAEGSYTLIELPKIFSDVDFREQLVSQCKNRLVKNFWLNQEKRPREDLAQKFAFFAEDEFLRFTLGQKKSAFNFNDIVKSKKIFLANLDREKMGEQASSFLASLFLSQINDSDFSLYLDEIDVDFPYFSKLRLTSACQTLNKKIDAAAIACFRVRIKEAKLLKEKFSPVFSAQDLIEIENFNFYLKPKGEISPFNVKTYSPARSNKERAWEIKEYCALTFGRDKDLIEEEIEKRAIVSEEKLKYNTKNYG